MKFAIESFLFFNSQVPGDMPKTPRGPASAIRVGSSSSGGNGKIAYIHQALATTPTTSTKHKANPVIIAPKNTQKTMKTEIWSSPSVIMDHQYGQTPEHLYLSKNLRFSESRAQVNAFTISFCVDQFVILYATMF